MTTVAQLDNGDEVVVLPLEGDSEAAYKAEFIACKKSPIYFILKYVKIKNSRGEVKDFDLNRIQKRAYMAMKERFFKHYTTIDGEDFCRFQRVRLVVCKFRQIGFSTLLIAIILHDTMFWAGTESVIFLHKEKFGKAMLERLKKLYERLPSWIKPPRLRKDLDNTSQFSFSSIDSKIMIGSPGTSEEQAGDQGRSLTVNNVMISEMPRYRYQAAFMQGLMAAIKDGNCFIESTPLVKGDQYHSIFSKGRRGENDWLALFYAWHEDPDKRIPLRDDAERMEIRRTLSDDEKELMRKFSHVIEENIKWRRWSILNEYDGNARRFKQENPDDEFTAFTSSGFCFFDDPEFEIKRTTTIFKEPEPGEFYAHGVDVAKGLGEEHDASVISVINCKTQEQVFEYRSNTLSDQQLPYVIYETWRRYPGVVGIESNFGGGVIAVLRHGAAFKDDELFQNMLWSDSPQHDGWRTGTNKRGALSELYNAIKEAVRFYAIEGAKPLRAIGLRIASMGLVDEMGTFLDLGRGGDRDGGLGAVEGSGNHDDRVIAIMIAWQMCKFYAAFHALYKRVKEKIDGTPNTDTGHADPDD